MWESLSNILEGGIGGLIAGLLILGVQWFVNAINQPKRDGNEITIKGIRLIESKDAKINFEFSTSIQFDICWRHSNHLYFNFLVPSSFNIIPLIVREGQSKFVVIIYNEYINGNTVIAKYMILNSEKSREFYKLAKCKESLIEFNISISKNSAQNKIIVNWNKDERQAVEEVLYVYLKHQKKLN